MTILAKDNDNNSQKIKTQIDQHNETEATMKIKVLL